MTIGGGFKAIRYSLNVANRVGCKNLFQAVLSKDACKGCSFGTGGQKGGTHNEAGQCLEVCKKNVQVYLTDIQNPIPESVFADKTIDDLKQMKGRKLEQLGRLNVPLYKQAHEKHYRPISYEQAVDKVVARMKQTAPERSFFYSSGRSSNEAAFLLQLFARLYGTNHISNCSYYCHQASAVGLSSALGTGTSTLRFKDLALADVIFVFGANPASNHPRFVKQLMQCRRRRGHVIVVNPVKESGLVRFAVPSDWRSMVRGGSPIASVYIQPHIGGDVAFMKGVAKYLLERDLIDDLFISQHTHHFDQYRQDIEQCSWDDICTQSGVSKDEIESVGRIYGGAKKVVFSWGLGMNQHAHGVENIESIVNLALLQGMVGHPGAGFLPLRGHSNVQGVGSMGVTPKLKDAVLENMENKMGVRLPTQPGMDTMASMEAAFKGEIDFAFFLGGNLFSATPDATFAEQALNNVAFKASLSTTLNMGHVHGVDQEVVIFPVAVREENTQATTQESMFNFVRLSSGNIIRFEDIKTETEIISAIASAVIPTDVFSFEPFKRHKNIRKAIAQAVPGFEKLEEIDDSREEFHITGRSFYTPEFATPDKKARFQVAPSPLIKRETGKYLMMTVRSEGQFNTIIYEEEDIYRGQKERWVVLMSASDMAREGLQEDDKVTLRSKAGVMQDVKARQYDIRPGCLLTYFPEANVLVPRDVDSRSQTPAFKSFSVVLERN